LKWCFVIDVAIDARMHAAGAQFFEPPIKILPALAKHRVIGIAQRQYGEFRMRQPRRVVAIEKFPKSLGVVRRIALSVGAGDEQEVLLTAQIGMRVLRKLHHFWGETMSAG